MELDLGPDEMIFVGAAVGMLRWFGERLPPGSVVLVEEPEIIHRRGIAALVAGLPVVSRVPSWTWRSATPWARSPRRSGAAVTC